MDRLAVELEVFFTSPIQTTFRTIENVIHSLSLPFLHVALLSRGVWTKKLMLLDLHHNGGIAFPRILLVFLTVKIAFAC